MEIEIMTKYDKDFNQNLYDGIDVDKDKEKLTSYVNHFTEFTFKYILSLLKQLFRI